MGLNNDLYDMYDANWNGFLNMQDILNNDGIYNYSSPLLMYCWEEDYENCNKKILFVGQETNSWFDSGSSLDKDSMDQVIENYRDFELGCGYNSPFWNFVRKLNRKFNNSDYCFLWTNINKFGLHGESGRAPEKVLALENSNFNLLKDELSIIKPDAVVFLTGPNYDGDLLKKLGPTDFLLCTDDYTEHEFAQLENDYLPEKSFRIYHPNFLSHSGLTNSYLETLSNLL